MYTAEMDGVILNTDSDLATLKKWAVRSVPHYLLAPEDGKPNPSHDFVFRNVSTDPAAPIVPRRNGGILIGTLYYINRSEAAPVESAIMRIVEYKDQK